MSDTRIQKLRSYRDSLHRQDEILAGAMRSGAHYEVPVPGAAPIKRAVEQINADFPGLVLAFSYHTRPEALRSQIGYAITSLDAKIREIESEDVGQAGEEVDRAGEAPPRRKVFIGHGRSPIWRELKDFIADQPGLLCQEYNSEPAAGFFTPERLSSMLDEACFAFLVMTPEDEQLDGSVRPRENVIHEAGLFQGRLGFRKAIILLEEGCDAFSNIQGLTVIPFTKGQIRAAFAEVRRTLEREHVLPQS